MSQAAALKALFGFGGDTAEGPKITAEGKLAAAVEAIIAAMQQDTTSAMGSTIAMLLSQAGPMVIKRIDRLPADKQDGMLQSLGRIVDMARNEAVSRDELLAGLSAEMLRWQNTPEGA